MEEKQHVKQKQVDNLRMVTNYNMEEVGETTVMVNFRVFLEKHFITNLYKRPS
jgi:hypothetical protein